MGLGRAGLSLGSELMLSAPFSAVSLLPPPCRRLPSMEGPVRSRRPDCGTKRFSPTPWTPCIKPEGMEDHDMHPHRAHRPRLTPLCPPHSAGPSTSPTARIASCWRSPTSAATLSMSLKSREACRCEPASVPVAGHLPALCPAFLFRSSPDPDQFRSV